MSIRSITIAILLSWTIALQSASAARIVVFGDSWGAPSAKALQAVLHAEGLPDTVAGEAVGGTTAANLASRRGLEHIADSLAANSDADIVHLTIGGNDFISQWNSSLSPAEGDALFRTILMDIEAIVDHILRLRPGVRIFWSSYDYLRPQSIGTPTEVNAATSLFSMQAMWLANSKGSAVTYHDFAGLMQVTFGFDGKQATPYDPAIPIPPGDPSLPDPTLPSPKAAFTDYIHLTQAGYVVLARAQYEVFYAAALAARVPAGSSVSMALPGSQLGQITTVRRLERRFHPAGRADQTREVSRPAG